MTLENMLWTEKYRPKTANEYVFSDETQRQQVESWIKQGSIPNLLFSGDAGTGKTTLAKLLIHELGIHEYDILEINASRENGIDFVREKILGFVQTIPFGTFKVVLLDEADYISINAQASLRNDIEAYHASARFILTCNQEHKIIPALKSRCHTFRITKHDRNEFTARVANVLINENIDFTLETLDTYVAATYPDLRKCLNQLQVNSINRVLSIPESREFDENSLLLEATEMFKNGKALEGRKILLQYLSFNPGKIENIYRYFYENLDLWAKDQQQKDAAIIVIRNGLANISLVAIPEINVAATMCELSML